MRKAWLSFLSAAIFGIALLGSTAGAAAPPALSRPTDDIDAGTSTETTTLAYDFEHHLMDAGIDIQYVPISYKNYLWNGSSTANYTGSGLHIAGEWLPLSRYGKLGVGAGLGYYLLRNVTFGNGAHASLNTFPVEGYLVYRLDYVRNQILVPFAKVGADVTFAGQTGGPPGGPQKYYGFDYSGGMELCLNNLDRRSAREMARSIGIYSTYVVFEYLRSTDLQGRKGPDLRHDEYRIGLRFEM